MHTVACNSILTGEGTRSHREVSNNMRLALARTLNGRKRANSMNLTAMTNFMSLFKVQIDGKMHLRRFFRFDWQGSESGQRVIRTTSVLNPGRRTVWLQ